ncbi:MAG: hypothetical protein P8J86_12700 [Phycisphaerales bacterium]|nr:hypothetical protein [Phycisphaerales bacterium]
MSLRMKCKQYTSLAVAVTFVLLLNACGPSSAHKDTPDAMFVAAKEAVINDKPVALWNAMPSTYKTQINGLVHDFGAQVDAAGYDAVMGMVRDVAAMLKDKKTFVLNSPMIKSQMASEDIPMKVMEENYDMMVTFLQALSDSDLGSAAGLQKVDLGAIINKYGGTMIKLAKSVMEAAPPNSAAEVAQVKMMMEMLKKSSFVVTNKTATTATVTVSEPGPDGKPAPGQAVTMVKVDDGWVPQEMADQFEQAIAQAKAQMAVEMQDLNSGLKQAPMLVGMASGMMEPLKKAKTQAEFDKAVSQLMGMMGGMGPGPGAGQG